MHNHISSNELVLKITWKNIEIKNVENHSQDRGKIEAQERRS